jgi:hypothetical protein
MKPTTKKKAFNACLLTILLTGLTIMPEAVRMLQGSTVDPPITLTVQTDKQTYVFRQKVLINGSFSVGDSPATNFVVGLQINDSRGYPIALRTLQIGSSTQTWPITITALILQDTGDNTIDTVRSGSTVIAGMSVYNYQLTERTIYGGITIFDANMVPIAIDFFPDTIAGGMTVTYRFNFQVPAWACSGHAIIVGDVYSDEPRNAGRVLSPEKTLDYCISRTQQGLFQNPPMSPPPPQSTPGSYESGITLSPDPTLGTYNVYVIAQTSQTSFNTSSTTFNVQNSTGYPPQPSFVYSYSSQGPYVNTTISFDASSSTPEGTGDKMTSYAWNFGDGTPTTNITGNPPLAQTTHNYLLAGRFTITLNATDNEGLWSTTSKPIMILPESGPTANFTWTPPVPTDAEWVYFDASNSTPGWDANSQSFSPIQNYTWNFGDGNITTATSPTITHLYGHEGNYNINLTVVDAALRKGSASDTIQVINATGAATYDVNGDGIINLKDVYAVALAFGSSPGDPNWNPLCDFNQDGVVNLKDYYPVCMHFGETV